MAKYGLVVGVGEYSDPEITNLAFAAQDAEAVSRCLREICGFDEVRLLASGKRPEPDNINIVDALEHFAPLLKRDDLFLFYFAGHGIETQTGAHLLTANSRIRMPELASISKAALADCLSRIECADRVLILDACRNDPHKGMGDGDNNLTAGFSRDILAVARTSVEGVVPATCVLFSCTQGERAYEWPEQGHGAFTHYLIEGLRGASRDAQGRLTVQRLGQYVQEQVPRWARKARTPRPQTPWGEQFGALREIVLSDRTSPPALHVETLPPGTCLIVDGHRVGRAPRRLTLSTGDHRIRAEKEGYRPWERRIRFDGAGDAELRIELEELGEPLPPGWTSSRRRVKAATPSGDVELDIAYFRNTVGMEFVKVPTGEFMMGDTLSPEDVDRRWPGGQIEWYKDAHPRHRVRIGRDFFVGALPVTRGQFAQFVNKTRYVTDAEKAGTARAYKDGKWGEQKGVNWRSPLFEQTDEHPVVCMSWNDAKAYCEWLSKTEGVEYRLPSEAEWEYAARAGSDATTWYWGDDEQGAQGCANVACKSEGWQYYFKGVEDGYKFTSPAGVFQPNAFGLHDMIGNVWEWCEDVWHNGYQGAPTDGSAWTAGGNTSARVLRGGGWFYNPSYCRSAFRTRFTPDFRINYVGFRVVLDSE